MQRLGKIPYKLKIALFGKLSLEEAMDLSRDRLILELELTRQLLGKNSPIVARQRLGKIPYRC
jgi:hypothetical protein